MTERTGKRRSQRRPLNSLPHRLSDRQRIVVRYSAARSYAQGAINDLAQPRELWRKRLTPDPGLAQQASSRRDEECGLLLVPRAGAMCDISRSKSAFVD
jgi:hypothetical protein